MTDLAQHSFTSEPRLAARLLIIHPVDHHVLVVTRKHDLNRLCFPGGKIEPGESIQEGVVRETLEETGLHVPHHTLIPIHVGYVHNDVPNDPHVYEVHTFFAPWNDAYAHPKMQEERVIPQWVTPEEYLNCCMDFAHDSKVWEAMMTFEHQHSTSERMPFFGF